MARVAQNLKKNKSSKPRRQKAVAEEILPEVSENKKSILSKVTSYRPSAVGWIVIAAVILLLIFSIKKDLILAATVNSTPITNIELLARLNQQYRTQMLNQLINEKLILGEAQKNGVIVSNQEINDRITKLEGNVGGAQALDSLLTQQGQTRSGLRDQLKFQLIIEKLYDKEATTSAEEIDKFIAENKESLQATTSAEQAKEAEEILKQQKLSKAFNEKFQELKTSAKIQIF